MLARRDFAVQGQQDLLSDATALFQSHLLSQLIALQIRQPLLFAGYADFGVAQILQDTADARHALGAGTVEIIVIHRHPADYGRILLIEQDLQPFLPAHCVCRAQLTNQCLALVFQLHLLAAAFFLQTG